MEIIDFYKGFECESELEIYERDQNGNAITHLKIWIGYFDKIMSYILPNSEGNWEGISLYYHTLTGWYEKSNWECREKNLFALQLESVEKELLDPICRDVLVYLIKIFKADGNVYFDYF